MKKAMGETERRRKLQEDYNISQGITPATIKKRIRDSLTGKFSIMQQRLQHLFRDCKKWRLLTFPI